MCLSVTTDICLEMAPPHTHASSATLGDFSNFGEENFIHCPGEQQTQIVRQCDYLHACHTFSIANLTCDRQSD